MNPRAAEFMALCLSGMERESQASRLKHAITRKIGKELFVDRWARVSFEERRIIETEFARLDNYSDIEEMARLYMQDLRERLERNAFACLIGYSLDITPDETPPWALVKLDMTIGSGRP